MLIDATTEPHMGAYTNSVKISTIRRFLHTKGADWAIDILLRDLQSELILTVHRDGLKEGMVYVTRERLLRTSPEGGNQFNENQARPEGDEGVLERKE